MWRVRTIAVDGRKIGRTWKEEFYSMEEDADQRYKELRETSGRFADGYEEPKLDTVGGITGECWWRSGMMLTKDKIRDGSGW